MRTREMEARQVMIERGRSPTVCRVTLRARATVIPRYMIGICRSVVIRLVARVAIGRQAATVLPVGMTQSAARTRVRTRQLK